MSEAVIVEALRTPIARGKPGNVSAKAMPSGGVRRRRNTWNTASTQV